MDCRIQRTYVIITLLSLGWSLPAWGQETGSGTGETMTGAEQPAPAVTANPSPSFTAGTPQSPPTTTSTAPTPTTQNQVQGSGGTYQSSELPPLALPEPAPKYPRKFALGVTLLKEHGFGAFARLRFDHLAIDVAYGLYPIIVMIEYGDDVDFKADISYIHVDGGLIYYFSDDQRRFQHGIRLAGIYDDIMSGGFMFGWVGDLVWGQFGLGLGAGIQVLPAAQNRILKHFDLNGIVKVSPLVGILQVYVGVNLFWYL
jgi:hypothetical protein